MNEVYGEGSPEGYENPNLRGRTQQQRLGIGDQRSEVRHGSEAQKYYRRQEVPEGQAEMEHDAEHARFLKCRGVLNEFGEAGKRKVGYDYAQTDWEKLVWLHLSAYREVDKNQRQQQHDTVAPIYVCYSRGAQEVQKFVQAG